MERVRKDVHFINVNLKLIQQYRSLINNIAIEYKKANTYHPDFNTLQDHFDKMYAYDMVQITKLWAKPFRKLRTDIISLH